MNDSNNTQGWYFIDNFEINNQIRSYYFIILEAIQNSLDNLFKKYLQLKNTYFIDINIL